MNKTNDMNLKDLIVVPSMFHALAKTCTIA